MFPDQEYGRFSVKEDGTLVIDRVEADDADEYICQAQSVAGTAYAKAKLDVKGRLGVAYVIVMSPRYMFFKVSQSTRVNSYMNW